MQQQPRTADGVEIVEGLVVFTNEMRTGVVRAGHRSYEEGWFDVEYADGRRVMMNGDRVATRFEGRDALAEHTGGRA